MSLRLVCAKAVLFLVLAAGCASKAEPRSQLLVVLDTDLPVVDQIRTRPDLSNDAAMDSVRVDILDENDRPFDFIDVTVADPLDWPVSFGVATEGKASVHLRARVFRAQHASAGELNGVQTLEPHAGTAIDRILDIALPPAGIAVAHVMLGGDCLGIAPSFAKPARTCIDGARRHAPASDGIDVASDDSPTPSRVGTWAPAKEVPCSKPSTGDRICIPGGYSLLGQEGLRGLNDGIILRVPSVPLKPVRLSPFYLDKTELTVAEFDELLATHPSAITGPLPRLRDPATPTTRDCTWLGGRPGNERFPLNCVSHVTAAQICAARGGMLPSEAQWEHAARGRGQGRSFPWGEADPYGCCVAAIGCIPGDLQPVGSHPANPGRCEGAGDVSRDGVIDMAGSVRELTRDAIAAYDAPCWAGEGIPLDPVCSLPETAFVSRGAAWRVAPEYGYAALRTTVPPVEENDDLGVRCAYSDGGP
jgi:formylglycine-generating enzyme required for sulfatase activity